MQSAADEASMPPDLQTVSRLRIRRSRPPATAANSRAAVQRQRHAGQPVQDGQAIADIPSIEAHVR